MNKAIMLVAAAVIPAGAAYGDYTLDSITRQCRAWTWSGPSVSDITTETGAWSAEVYSEHTDSLHVPGKPSWGRAWQQSSYETGTLNGVGEESGFDGLSSGGAGAGEGSNHYEMLFTVYGSETAFMAVTSRLPRGRAGSVYVALDTAAGEPIFSTWFLPREGLIQSLPLNSGSYRFTAKFYAGHQGAATGEGYGAHELVFSIPSPGAVGLGMGLLLARARRSRR